MAKKPTPIRKDQASAMLFARIRNVEVAGKGTDAVLIVTVAAKLDQAALRTKLTLDKMWERQAVDDSAMTVQLDETP